MSRRVPKKIADDVALANPNDLGFTVIADSIVKASESMKALKESRLSTDALVILLSAKTGIKKSDIVTILFHLENLEKNFLKPQLKARA